MNNRTINLVNKSATRRRHYDDLDAAFDVLARLRDFAYWLPRGVNLSRRCRLFLRVLALQLASLNPYFSMLCQAVLYGVINNQTLLAVPLFVFMGAMLERAKIAENLLTAMSLLMGRFHGGLAIAVTLVGMLLAASTGIVGATVVTMGLLSLPTMLKRGYDPKFSTGIICATGTLGQIIPPSIALVLLGDVLIQCLSASTVKNGHFQPRNGLGWRAVCWCCGSWLITCCFVYWLLSGGGAIQTQSCA